MDGMPWIEDGDGRQKPTIESRPRYQSVAEQFSIRGSSSKAKPSERSVRCQVQVARRWWINRGSAECYIEVGMGLGSSWTLQSRRRGAEVCDCGKCCGASGSKGHRAARSGGRAGSSGAVMWGDKAGVQVPFDFRGTVPCLPVNHIKPQPL